MDRGNVAIDRNAYAPSRLGEMESMVEVLDLSWDHSLKQRSMGTIRGNKMSAVFTCRLCQQLRRLFLNRGIHLQSSSLQWAFTSAGPPPSLRNTITENTKDSKD